MDQAARTDGYGRRVMNQKRARALSLLVGALLAGCGGSAAQGSISAPSSAASAGSSSGASREDTMQSLVDGARKEGALTLVWGEGALGGSRDIPKIAAGFNK